MSCNIETIAVFDKQLKRLAKKYVSLKTDLLQLLESIKENPVQGTLLFNNCYKIRLNIQSKSKGKAGGARIITYYYVVKNILYLLMIYDKSELENITDAELKKIIQELNKP